MKYLGFAGPTISGATTQLRCCGAKAALDSA